MIYAIAAGVVVAAQILLVLAMGMACIRMARGPHAPDRVVALDALYLDAMLLILATGIATGSMLYAEAAMIIGLLGFAGTAAFAKFLIHGEVIR